VTAVGGFARRLRVERDGYRVPGRGVDDAGVTAAVARSPTAIPIDARVVTKVDVVARVVTLLRLKPDAHHQAVPSGIREVVSRDAVASALRGADHAAIERSRVRRLDRVGHVARLQVREGLTVG